ncbi:MAG TPA: 50S ribosomal protein L3 [Candidatus Omnitrophota bacterium]|nr:50S ribosomal protein L3 [Candidatus Omnitrophota bacterium]
MIRGLLGKKLGMTQIFDKDGNVVPVTVVEAGPCPILELKNEPKIKVKIGFLEVKEQRVDKPRQGLFKKANVAPRKVVREFESAGNGDYQVGQEIKADVFKAGEFVDVSAVSKGKGFQGGMKRHHWSGGPAAHGSMHHRRVGSIGSSACPSRTFRGQRMPGHMGAERTTIQGLRVMEVDATNNILLIKGAVPGAKNGLLEINRSKKRAYRSLEDKPANLEKKRNPIKQSKSKAKGKK